MLLYVYISLVFHWKTSFFDTLASSSENDQILPPKWLLLKILKTLKSLRHLGFWFFQPLHQIEYTGVIADSKKLGKNKIFSRSFFFRYSSFSVLSKTKSASGSAQGRYSVIWEPSWPNLLNQICRLSNPSRSEEAPVRSPLSTALNSKRLE